MFRDLVLGDWRQFRRVHIEFDDRLTVLTGANGSGKTTILGILGKHFGWDVPLIRSPFASKRGVVRKFLREHWETQNDRVVEQGPPADALGSITYSDGHMAYLVEPSGEELQFNLEIRNKRPIHGIHIPSHRPIPGRADVRTLPTSPPTKTNAVNNYRQEVLRRYLGQRSQNTPGLVLKQTLMTLCLVGEGSNRVTTRTDLRETLYGFEAILRALLPQSFGFETFEVGLPELYLRTANDRIPFDALSGGLTSLIDIAYQIYMFSPPGRDYVAIIDEPENHLHPAMQRRFLPDLIAAFPNVQFIVATHNPFVIGSTSDSRVYALVFEGEQVETRYLELASKSGSAEEILHDVLGMESTLPLWVEQMLDAILPKYVEKGLSPGSLAALRNELTELGLDNVVIDALAEFGRSSRQNPDA